MSLATIRSRALVGVRAPSVEVEAHLANGLPSFNIVGLPDTEVKESRDRVRAAILHSGFDFPAKRITVNLAPAELPKDSGRFDLPIAVAILAASGQIQARDLAQYELAGELALSGTLRPVRGALAMLRECEPTARNFILPTESAQWGAWIENSTVYGARTLCEVAAHFNNIHLLPTIPPQKDTIVPDYTDLPDLKDVKGQESARMALELAASGGHSLLMMGPPGTGKSMLAQCLPSILPPLSKNEMIEHIVLQTLSRLNNTISYHRPFRSPHHSASAAALVGGGSDPKPGEISLAHNGVLFLDELPEFDRKVLEVLREPIESGVIHLSRVLRQVSYPAHFQLISAMNPCPCGYLGHATRACHCSIERIERYRHKISGPLLDRIDLIIEVPSLTPEEINSNAEGESSQTVRERVLASRARQLDRQGKVNAKLTTSELNHIALITTEAKTTLSQLIDQLNLSARSFHRILRIARTVADQQNDTKVETAHVLMAINFRRVL